MYSSRVCLPRKTKAPSSEHWASFHHYTSRIYNSSPQQLLKNAYEEKEEGLKTQNCFLRLHHDRDGYRVPQVRCFLISHSTLNPNLDPYLSIENGHWRLLDAQAGGRCFQGSAPWTSMTIGRHLTLKTHPSGSPEATPQTLAPHFLSADLPPPPAPTHSRPWLSPAASL